MLEEHHIFKLLKVYRVIDSSLSATGRPKSKSKAKWLLKQWAKFYGFIRGSKVDHWEHHILKRRFQTNIKTAGESLKVIYPKYSVCSASYDINKYISLSVSYLLSILFPLAKSLFVQINTATRWNSKAKKTAIWIDNNIYL